MTTTLLHHLLDERARTSPDAVALSDDGHAWTYAELRARTVTAAGRLAARGVGRGDRILVLDRNDPGTVVLVFAASRVGAVYVVVSDATSEYYLRHIVADCAPRLVLGTAPAPVDVVDPAEITGPGDPESTGWTEGLATDPLSLIYTSGSTAMPKAVVSTHQQVLFAVDAIQDRLRYQPDDVVLGLLPLSFDYGLYQVFLTFTAGARLVLATGVGPNLLHRLVSARITVFPLVPSLAVTLCQLSDRSGGRPWQLRMVTNTGAALAAPLAARLRDLVPGLSVVAMYGLTECKRVSIAEPDADLVRPGTVGRPLRGTEAYVVGPAGQRLGPGEVGELVVRGPHVMAGYWNAPEQTGHRFRRDHLGLTTLYTGDHCRIDEDGYLYFVGRHDDIYKQNGFRVSTSEVEAAALDVTGVAYAVALAPDGRCPARLAVTGAVTAPDLINALAERLQRQRIPTECVVLDELPLTVNGKVDRIALRQRWSELTRPKERVS